MIKMVGNYVIVRRETTWSGDPLEATVAYRDVEWHMVRYARTRELEDTDWWVLRGNMTDAQAAYRQFLRDLPQNYAEAGANAACDAWEAYDISGL